jgi:Uma2 family endonuclease
MNPLFADKPLVLDDPYMSRMSEAEFFDFCQQHRKWRIERNAQQEILIMAPAFTRGRVGGVCAGFAKAAVGHA